MEKINVAELLKDCPRNMELDCTIFNNVTLQCVDNGRIWIGYIDSENNIRVIHLTCYGGVKIKNIETKCVIFPKGKTTWEGFVPPCQFKVGDTITNGKTSFTIGYIDDEYYYETGRNIAIRLCIKNQDDWELVHNKFDINTLIPFESKVLVRAESGSGNLWKPAIFGCYVEDKYAPYYVLGGTCWSQCLPYEGNEHLLGTADDCDEYFKTWE